MRVYMLENIGGQTMRFMFIKTFSFSKDIGR